MALTIKQENFAQEVVKQGNYSNAYRAAYDCARMTSKQINEEASILMSNPKISQRVEDLKSIIQSKKIYTVEQSIKRDIRLIERYECALDVLEDNTSENKDVEIAERLIRHIGQSGYSSAQDRISKQSGFYEKDNSQKAAPSFVMFDARKKP